jgi:hypothetical protein
MGPDEGDKCWSLAQLAELPERSAGGYEATRWHLLRGRASAPWCAAACGAWTQVRQFARSLGDVG